MIEDTVDGIHEFGHRTFIGGGGDFWDVVSEKQFAFLKEQGLQPKHVFVDVACGSLRGGVKLIPYLDRGNYLGIDKFVELLIYGVASELGVETFKDKRPRFVVSDDFAFGKFDRRPDYGIAQSLFSHLNAADIRLCLKNLRPQAAAGCRFFATFCETAQPGGNPEQSHSHGRFEFTRAQMEGFGRDTGWQTHYIGDWGHPRGQHMIEYRAG